MIENAHKYDNMYENEIIYALICINNHAFSCQFSMLSLDSKYDVLNENA